jgi:hypothetical protein
MSTSQPTVTAVALPATTLRLLVGSIIIAVMVMTAMLALEVAILIQVFELNDLVAKLVPPGL